MVRKTAVLFAAADALTLGASNRALAQTSDPRADQLSRRVSPCGRTRLTSTPSSGIVLARPTAGLRQGEAVMRERSRWERAVRRIVTETLRLVPPARALGAIERLAPLYARLALRTGGVLLPRSLRDFPDKVARYFGADRGRERRARLVEARLVFLLTRLVLNQAVRGRTGAESRRLLPIAVDGAEYLDAALAERRGLVLVSAHFGLPALIRLVLEGRGARVVGVGGSFIQGVDVATGRDVWTRARALQRLRAEVEGGSVCVLLADVWGRHHLKTPFLQGRIRVTPGPSPSPRPREARCCPSSPFASRGHGIFAWRSARPCRSATEPAPRRSRTPR